MINAHNLKRIVKHIVSPSFNYLKDEPKPEEEQFNLSGNLSNKKSINWFNVENSLTTETNKTIM